MRRSLPVAALALAALVGGAAPPGVLVDFSEVPPVAAGAPFLRFAAARGYVAEIGTPEFFSVANGTLRLVAAPGERSRSWNPMTLRKREDKVLLRLTPEGFRASSRGTLEIEMAPVLLPGKGADVTDSAKNDACFYLLLGFDGPRHRFAGSSMPDTLGYVWADAAWKSGLVGHDPEYAGFLRYVALGTGAERAGALRILRRDLAADFRKAFPDRAGDVPDIVSVAVMVDANTVGTRAESALRRVRTVPGSGRG